MDSFPLLTTKLTLPPSRHNLVPRPRLITWLNQSLQYRLTLILAPAGFGKTTLLSEWLATQTQVAWLALDEADNDPQRFCHYLLGALQTISAPIPPELWASLATPQTTYQPFFISLINLLTPLPGPYLLVFDDYHVITDRALHDLFLFWLTHLPPQFHIILASRVEPPFPLARLRTKGELLSLNVSELRFTLDEATTFLHHAMGLPLTPEDIRALDRRTEGWVAGLQLAALALQGAPQPHQFIAHFSGSHRYILDYLAHEVLQQQSPQVQQFLLETSILERLTADLCDQVTEQPNGQAMLTYLETANLFIIPLDHERKWYRYHALFAEFLRHRLPQTHPERVFALHQRAAAWCEAHHLIAEALSHALEAADVPRASRLIRQTASRILSRSEIMALMSWLHALSHEIKQAQPRVSLFQAWALLTTGQFERVEARLQEVLQTLADGSMDLLSEAKIIRATIAYLRRDMPTAIQEYRQALQELSPDNTFLRGGVALNLGLAYVWTGQIRPAAQLLRQAGEWHQVNHNLYLASIAWWNLAQLQQEQGQLHEATESYRQILALAHLAPHDLLGSVELWRNLSYSVEQPLNPDLSGAYVGWGQLSYERNDLTTATQNLTLGLELARDGTESILINAFIYLIRVKHAQGEWEQAFDLLKEAKTCIYRERVSPYWAHQLQAQQARLWLTQGNFEAVKQWLQEQSISLDLTAAPGRLVGHEASYFIALRWLIAQHRWAEAQTLLTPMLALAEAGGRRRQVIELLGLGAIVQQAQGGGQHQLERALALAEPEQFKRVFLDEGPSLVTLLQRIDNRSVVWGYAQQLLAELGGVVSVEPVLEPLTEREIEILQLMAKGYSNKAIAETLFLTVGTVKWYAGQIYGKLPAQNRTQAVARARALRLLSD